ncbi:MAG: DUF5655 domain-containing protein [Anaerolineales bacterium]|nr:DUF5655 domain-containing protein [Anaerolineales bacterium]MDP7345551.1 DUF5655 domain-containing protein [Anaerolineales bacterium]MDP7643300.1 DUF5655 domain-containing protein [Anaerolineales bacterium]HJN42358.1 DUF5655 domain-containing protein [Anaerolineales bacterium]
MGLRGVALISLNDNWSAFGSRRERTSTADGPLPQQYLGKKAALLSTYQRVMEETKACRPDVTVSVRKTYVSAARKMQCAVIKASTRSRIDLDLRLREHGFGTRLVAVGSFDSSSTTHWVALHSPNDVDAQLTDWLRVSYRQAR